MKTTIAALSLLVSVWCNSQPNVLAGSISKEAMQNYIGSYGEKMVFSEITYKLFSIDFKVFNLSEKKLEQVINFKSALKSKWMTYKLFKDSSAYFLVADCNAKIQELKSSMTKVSGYGIKRLAYGIEGVKKASLVRIDFPSGKVNELVIPVPETIEYLSLTPFFNSDSTTINIFYLNKLGKRNYTVTVLTFNNENLQKISETNFQVGDVNEYDMVLGMASDTQNNIKLFYRRELSKEESKQQNSFFRYTIYQSDVKTNIIDSADVLNKIGQSKDEVIWTWDNERKNCFFATFISKDYREKQTAVHFEKYSSETKSILTEEFQFAEELLNIYKESPKDGLPFLSNYWFNGIHLTPEGNLYVIGEYYDNPGLWRYFHGVYPNDYTEYQDNGQERIQTGPFMVFYLNNDLKIKWNKQFDKFYRKIPVGAFPMIARDYKLLPDGERLKIFFVDDTQNMNMVEGHPFVEKDPSGPKHDSKKAVFQLKIDQNGIAKKEVLYTDQKKVDAFDLMTFPVFFPFNKKYFYNCLTVVPVK